MSVTGITTLNMVTESKQRAMAAIQEISSTENVKGLVSNFSEKITLKAINMMVYESKV